MGDYTALIHQATQQLVASRSSFSAHDVTSTVRGMTSQPVAHESVRMAVHMLMGLKGGEWNYVRELVQSARVEGGEYYLYIPAEKQSQDKPDSLAKVISLEACDDEELVIEVTWTDRESGDIVGDTVLKLSNA